MIPVLWVTQVYPRHPGDPLGAFLHRLAREMPSRGYAPTVLTPGAVEAPPEEMRDGVRVVRVRYAPRGKQTLAYTGEMHRQAARHPLRFVAFLRAMRRSVREHARSTGSVIVHAHWWIPSGWVAAGPAARANVPFVLSLHGTDVRLLREASWLRPVARGVFRRAKRVLPVSDALRRAVDDLGLGGGDRVLLPMPPDDEIYSSGEAPGEGSSFLVAARLTRQKRIDVVIRAVATLTEQGVPVRVDVAGDGPERERLESLARELGVEGQVRFHGMVPSEDLASRYRSALAVILASVEEGYGLTAVEAGLCGTPAIGTRSGGIPELIEDGVGGLLVEPDSPRELAAAMQRLAADPVGARALGTAARAVARGRTPGPLADRLARVYAEVLAG